MAISPKLADGSGLEPWDLLPCLKHWRHLHPADPDPPEIQMPPDAKRWPVEAEAGEEIHVNAWMLLEMLPDPAR